MLCCTMQQVMEGKVKSQSYLVITESNNSCLLKGNKTLVSKGQGVLKNTVAIIMVHKCKQNLHVMSFSSRWINSQH